MDTEQTDFDFLWSAVLNELSIPASIEDKIKEESLIVLKTEFINHYGFYEKQCVELLDQYIDNLSYQLACKPDDYSIFFSRRSTCPVNYLDLLKSFQPKYKILQQFIQDEDWEKVGKMKVDEWYSFVEPLHEYVVKTFFTRPHVLDVPDKDNVSVEQLYEHVAQDMFNRYKHELIKNITWN